jgi:hypothetical protein
MYREAALPLVAYLTPGSTAFDPPCSIFHNGPYRILELGSGQALPSLHLAEHLDSSNVIVLSDLDNVIPLCKERVARWETTVQDHASVQVVPLAWGGDVRAAMAFGPFSHILMCDLVSDTVDIALMPGLLPASLSATLADLA